MSIIDFEIGPGSFELVRDRIGAILYDELFRQYAFSYEDWMNIKRVYLGRYFNINESELNCINVGIARGDLDGHTVLQADNTVQYWIDVHVGAKSSENVDGGALAVARMHRLVAICRQILEHSDYKTLAFPPPFVMYRRVMQMLFNPPETKDAYSVVVGRLVLHVKVPEENGVHIPIDIGSYKTVVKMHESERGYLYFGPPENLVGFGLDYTVDQTL
jgi:hypothetical protein